MLFLKKNNNINNKKKILFGLAIFPESVVKGSF